LVMFLSNLKQIYLIVAGVSKLVDEVFKFRDACFESLSLSDLFDELECLAGVIEWVGEECFPMVEDALRESSS